MPLWQVYPIQCPSAQILTNTLKTADFLHTFPDEVRFMWPAPLSLPKVLFLVLRYYHVVVHGAICAVCEYALLAPRKIRNG